MYSLPLTSALNHRFEVFIFPSLKVYYINRFYILMKIFSARLSSRLSFPIFRQSACNPPYLPTFIVFIYSSVRPYICLERWNCQANLVLAHIVLIVRQTVRSNSSCSSCFKSQTAIRSPVAFSSKISCCLVTILTFGCLLLLLLSLLLHRCNVILLFISLVHILKYSRISRYFQMFWKKSVFVIFRPGVSGTDVKIESLQESKGFMCVTT